MEDQSQNSVDFRMRVGKQIEYAFAALWCIALSAFAIWELTLFISKWSIPFILIYSILVVGGLLAGTIIFASSLFRVKLTFSTYGVKFQGLISSKNASWQEVTGLIEYNGEIYFKIDRHGAGIKDKPQLEIPLSWFTKMRTDGKFYRPDKVLTSLITYVPQFFPMIPPE